MVELCRGRLVHRFGLSDLFVHDHHLHPDVLDTERESELGRRDAGQAGGTVFVAFSSHHSAYRGHIGHIADHRVVRADVRDERSDRDRGNDIFLGIETDASFQVTDGI